MSLGGCAFLDSKGRILHVDRPVFYKVEAVLGKACWSFSKSEADKRRMQEAFAWAHSIGEPVSLVMPGPRAREFRVKLQRIAGTNDVVSQYALNQPDTLSDKERLIAELISKDFKARDICAATNISLSTFENHRSHILHKLQVDGTAGIALWFEEQKRWR